MRVDRPVRMAVATPTVRPPDRPYADQLASALNTTPGAVDDLCRYLGRLCEGCEYDQDDWVTVPYDSLSDLITAYRLAYGVVRRTEGQ